MAILGQFQKNAENSHENDRKGIAMPNGNENPDHRDLWKVVNDVRLDLAEIKGRAPVRVA